MGIKSLGVSCHCHGYEVTRKGYHSGGHSLYCPSSPRTGGCSARITMRRYQTLADAYEAGWVSVDNGRKALCPACAKKPRYLKWLSQYGPVTGRATDTPSTR